MSYALIVLVLVLLVVVHELGHFLVARATGIRATKFYVFFPPALFKRQVGDVEYGIGAIPAGGFVKLPGMFEPVPAEVARRLRWDVDDLPSDLGDPPNRLRLDAALRSLESAPGATALVEPLREFDASLAELQDQLGDDVDAATRRRVRRTRSRVENLVEDCHPRAYWRAALWRRMAVIFAGPLVNLVVAFVVLTLAYWLLVPTYQMTGPFQVAEVQEGSPAARAGIDEESAITEWNGPVVGESPDQVRDRIIASLGSPVDVAWVDGDGDEHAAKLRPEVLEEGDGARTGVAFGTATSENVAVVGRETTSIGYGVRNALDAIRDVTWGTVTMLPRVFFDREVREGVGSVVGIVQVASDVDKAGLIVRYIGLISLILAVMNLLPLLPLDGGHLLFGLAEAIRRGRPLPRAAFERYSMVGLALVLMLFFIGLDNDIERMRG